MPSIVATNLLSDFTHKKGLLQTIIATNLDNAIVGGVNDQRLGHRFQALHSSPLSAFRNYVIDNYPGYSLGNGGVLMADLSAEDNGKPGNVEAVGYKAPDPEFADPSSGRGRFPLVAFDRAITLTKGKWYWIVIGNDSPTPASNYFSMDYLMDATVLNQVPTMQVYQSVGNGTFALVPYLIPSPFVLQYANGLFQGLGWIHSANGVLECGSGYGFPAASCV